MATTKQQAPVKPKIVTLKQSFGLDSVSPWLDDYHVIDKTMSDRLVGIEIEVENHELLRDPRRVWIATEDGSLRNNGMEWITRPIPANTCQGVLSHLLNECLEDDCCFSPRTSVHVHVNCQDIQVEKIPNIIMLYAVLEPLLYRFTGRNRNKNIYCVPLLETALMSNLVDVGLSTIIGKWSKYAGLNVLPLSDKGTIEFRHMHGTRDVAKITTWVDMLTKLVDFVVKSDLGEMRKLLFGFDKKMNVNLLLDDIFGRQLADQLQYMDYSSIEGSVYNMKQAFISTDTFQKVLAERELTAPFFTAKIQRGF